MEGAVEKTGREVSARTLIVCKSVHHQNTSKVARAIADVLHAEICSPEDVSSEKLDDDILVGIGSGIYFGRFHSAVRRWVRQMPDRPAHGRRAFVFSTSGLPFLWRLWHWPLTSLLKKKGYEIVGQFHCRGFDTVGPLWLVGGINWRHPNNRDIEHAAAFARGLLPFTRA